jgi:hypothetical protein
MEADTPLRPIIWHVMEHFARSLSYAYARASVGRKSTGAYFLAQSAGLPGQIH